MRADPSRKLLHALGRIKGTLLIQAVLIVAGAVTSGLTSAEHERLLRRLGFDYELLVDGRIWHLVTGTWVQVTPGIEFSMLALVFGGTIFLEIFAGTRAMLLTCVTGDWFATILTALTTRALAGFGNSASAVSLAIPDAGSSALAHAGYGAAVMLLPRRWLKLAVPALVLLTVIQFWIVDAQPAVAHAWATLYGVLVGWLILRPRLAREPRLSLDDRVSMPPSVEVS